MSHPVSRLERHRSDVSDVSVRSQPEELALSLCIAHEGSAEKMLMTALPKQQTIEQTQHINQTLAFVRMLRS